MGNSLQQAMQAYQGHPTYFEYLRQTFKSSRDILIDDLKKATHIKFDPIESDSGYFMTADISQNKDKIPSEYLKTGSYEID